MSEVHQAAIILGIVYEVLDSVGWHSIDKPIALLEVCDDVADDVQFVLANGILNERLSTGIASIPKRSRKGQERGGVRVSRIEGTQRGFSGARNAVVVHRAVFAPLVRPIETSDVPTHPRFNLRNSRPVLQPADGRKVREVGFDFSWRVDDPAVRKLLRGEPGRGPDDAPSVLGPGGEDHNP